MYSVVRKYLIIQIYALKNQLSAGKNAINVDNVYCLVQKKNER